MADTNNNHDYGCCFCFIRFTITAGLTALFLWLSLRTSNPSLSIQQFRLSTLNHTIFVDLKLQNNMNEKGVHYSNTTLIIFHNNASTSLQQVSNFTVPDFYQGHTKTTHRKQTMDTVVGLVMRNGSSVDFSVKVFTRVRFKILFWYTKSKSLIVGGHVSVDYSGNKVSKKGVKLKSGVTVVKRSYWVGPFLGFSLLVLLFM